MKNSEPTRENPNIVHFLDKVINVICWSNQMENFIAAV